MSEQPPLKKRRVDQSKRKAKKTALSEILDDPLRFDILKLLGKQSIDDLEPLPASFQHLEEVDIDIVALSSKGDGLGTTADKSWVVAVPFCFPGERVRARIYRSGFRHSFGDLVQLLSANDATSLWPRDDALVKCKYFGQCSGCQYQAMPYTNQLVFKQDVVRNAFANLSGLTAKQIPTVQETIASPQQYQYRTKITPHFDQPNAKMSMDEKVANLAIGFETKGRRKILDIEECPISTAAINAGLVKERERVKDNLASYKRGATLLLRHSLDEQDGAETPICVTDHKQTVREKVAGKVFEFNAGSFFQNNNGILEALLTYVAEQVAKQSTRRYLVDTYCGSGLFGISLASAFETVTGVEISADSVKWAKHNASLNNIENATFLVGKAEAIFETITFPGQESTVLIDPPRKGCDEAFLRQLVTFAPQNIIYVSCNVHTQARDVGYLVKHGQYKITSLRGADLFPQTYHVEGVAVLEKS